MNPEKTPTAIYDPLQYDPDLLVTAIESDPEAFTEGRRNNDLVNWYLAKKLSDLRHNRLATFNAKTEQLIADFKQAYFCMPVTSQRGLEEWDEDELSKIRVLQDHYGRSTSEGYFAQLWLPLDYAMQVHPQLDLT